MGISRRRTLQLCTAWAKKFRHSSALNCASALAAAVSSASKVRAAALRTCALSLAKAFSIGLKSGL